MSDLRHARRQLKIIFGALALLDVVAAAVLLSPLVGSERARHQQLDGLWKDLQQKTRMVEPLRGLDKKIVVAQQQIDGFYKTRLPERDSAIYETLGRVAGQTGVNIGHVKATRDDPEPVGLTPVELEADLSGNYLQLVRFLNAVERDQLFFLVNSVELGGEQNGVVKLQIKFETFLRTGA
jgi:type IV pilus assembly protein PilO